ncbi:MAG: neutral/alkaline non-lysosomal ceramidase N-terminal domain-containing protein [Bacteroidales bacterium]
MAGFDNARAANGIHDDLWSRCVIIDDGQTRLAMVAIDAIGFMNTEVEKIRKKLDSKLGITYLVVASTHTHEAPDLMGLWGKTTLKSGVDRKYNDFVRAGIIRSVEVAVENIRPVRLELSEDLHGADGLVNDTRKPEVFDNGIRVIRFIDRQSGKTNGSLITWADHPEVLWGKNLLITSDYCHFLRDAVENGVYATDGTKLAGGTGGIAVYFNGAIGGLMTTSPSLTVKDGMTGQEYKDPTFEKARALGSTVAMIALKAMENPSEYVDSAKIGLVVARPVLPLDNKDFRLAKLFGIIKRKGGGLRRTFTELAAFNIGPASFLTLPGEVYPELVNGGIEAPENNDFNIAPSETPPLRDMMKGRFKFIIGLANDEIGYILPKSQWDVEKPFTYGRKSSPYGEGNSLGPETARILHDSIVLMLKKLN